jgi:hypothetical protein
MHVKGNAEYRATKPFASDYKEMEELHYWMPTELASEALHVSVSVMHELKRRGVLQPGKHYYVAGVGISGPMIWNVLAVRETLLEETAKKGIRTKNTTIEPETYDSETVTQNLRLKP